MFLFLIAGTGTMKAQMFYQDSHLFIGQKPQQWAYVGDRPGYYVGTDFGIEFYEAGLNIWKPNGTYMWGNYKLFLDSIGRFGIGRKPATYALEVDGQVGLPTQVEHRTPPQTQRSY